MNRRRATLALVNSHRYYGAVTENRRNHSPERWKWPQAPSGCFNALAAPWQIQLSRCLLRKVDGLLLVHSSTA
jgi:hypothetical protein